MVRRLLRMLILRPYNDNLCSPATRHWQILATIGVLLMGSTEGAGWWYVGFFLGHGMFRYVSAFWLGAIAAAAVWIVDTSFLTLDLRRREYEQTVAHAEQSFVPQRRSGLSARLHSPFMGVLLRLVMAAGSLYVAAPYVTQLFFSSDISAALTNQRSAAIQDRRTSIISQHTAHLDRLRHEADSLNQQLVNETAGRGPSRRFGRGPTAVALEAQLNRINEDAAQAETALKSEVAAYDSMSPAQLAERYGVTTVGEGIQARNRAMELIRQQPGYGRTEWTIRALLLGLFLVLVVLKLYQPLSANIYYSEFCQDAYKQYLAGNLPVHPQQPKDNKAIAELAFDIWLRTDYSQHERYTHNAAALAFIQANRALKESKLKEIQAEAEAEMAPLLVDLEDANKRLQDTEQELLDMESDINAVEGEISEHRRIIADIDTAFSYPRSPGGFAKALETREAWQGGLATLEKSHRKSVLALEKAKSRLAAQQAEAKRITAAIECMASVLANANRYITKCRNQALDDIDRHGL